MNILKKIANVFGILIAFVLSLLLTAFLITAPVLSATASFLQSDTIHEVVDSIDFAELIKESGALGSAETEGPEADMMEQLMESEMMGQIIDLYLEGVFAVLEGDAEDVYVTTEAINAIIQENVDELVPILKAYIGTDIQVPDEEVRKLALEMTGELAKEIALAMPTADDLGLDESVRMGMEMLRSGQILLVIVAVAALLSVLIFLCRFMRFKGFMWLGVVYLLSALLTLMTAVGAGKTAGVLLEGSIPAGVVSTEAVTMIVDPLMSVFSTEMMKGAGVLGGLAVLFIAIFIVGRVILKKRRVEQTVEPMIDQTEMF